MTQFKTAVTKVLTKHASAILMDPEFGLPALEARAPGTGVLLAYEKTGYDTTDDSRLPDLLPEWSVRRLAEAGADAIKVLLYYNPEHPESVNTVKKAFIERIGSECQAVGCPLLPGADLLQRRGGRRQGTGLCQGQAGHTSRPTWQSSPSPSTAWTCSRSKCRST